jgi:hypothetical protein
MITIRALSAMPSPGISFPVNAVQASMFGRGYQSLKWPVATGRVKELPSRSNAHGLVVVRSLRAIALRARATADPNRPRARRWRPRQPAGWVASFKPAPFVTIH